MATFLGIGLGPIQTGIFLPGARRGGFSRIVVADVDRELVAAVRAGAGRVQIGVASEEGIAVEDLEAVEILNPCDDEDRRRLVEAAAEATELSTALPSVRFYAPVVEWLAEGLARRPNADRLCYAAENHNTAAEQLAALLGKEGRRTACANTVIGKMSGVLGAQECRQRGVPTLTPTADRGHLVEAFDTILVEAVTGIERRRVAGLTVKPRLQAFEEAKLYGHNAIHLLLGLHARQLGCERMSDLREHPAITDLARAAFVEESGRALCAKWTGVDTLFTPEGFQSYADDLLRRMTNPWLGDRVERVCRDLERKLGWDDRLIGAIRLALSQDVEAPELCRAAAMAAGLEWGTGVTTVREGLRALWAGDATPGEMATVLAAVEAGFARLAAGA